MAVELVRDLLTLDQTIGEGSSQVLVEGDILVPDVKPDISRIISVDGVVNITEKEAVQDKVIIDGVVNFKILYVSDGADYPVYSMDASTGFSQNIDILNTNDNMNIDVVAEVEHIDHNIMNERKISVKTVVNVTGKTHRASRMEVLKDLMGVEDVQVLKKKVSYTDTIGANKSETMIREGFELEENLPDIEQVLKCDALAVAKEAQVTDDKVIVSGVVKTSTLYIADDGKNTLMMLKHEIPFTHFVEVMGAMKDMNCKTMVKADEVYTDVKENIEGNRRILEIEAMVKIDASVNEMEEKEVLVDAYCPGKTLNIEKQKMTFGQTAGDNSSNMVVKETVELPKAEPEIAKVFNVNCKPLVTDVSITDEKCIIEGIIEAHVLYLSHDEMKPVSGFSQEIPFRHFIEVPGCNEAMHVDVEIHVNDVDYNVVNTEQMELKVNIGAHCVVTKQQQMDVVVNITESEDEVDISKRPSITIYYVQPGDTLWKIAKRYHTTVKELVETNDILNPDMIMPGDQIIIQKKLNHKF